MTNPLDRYVEAEPLLPDEDCDAEILDDLDEFGKSSSPWARWTETLQVKQQGHIILLLAILMFLITTSGMMFLLPVFRLVEDAFCHRYYDKDPSEPIDERLCKVDGVQKELAYLGGLGSVVNSFVGIATALPYGVLADRQVSACSST